MVKNLLHSFKNLCLCLFIIAAPNYAVAGKSVSLILEVTERGRLNIALLNNSNHPELVNIRFALGPFVGFNEIRFIITDSENTRHYFSAKNQLLKAGKKDFLYLAPGKFIGHQFRIIDIAKTYELDAGQYNIKAVYECRWQSIEADTFCEKLESNDVAINVR